ncbi:hypothetical protein ACWEQC_32670 [Streptomyces shenzhenensis]
MSRILRILYILAAAGTGACAAVSHLDHRTHTVTAFLAITALLLATAVHRESVCAEDHHQAAPAPDHDPAATDLQAWLHTVTELDNACCERWWTSLATDHDPTCPHHTRKDPTP